VNPFDPSRTAFTGLSGAGKTWLAAQWLQRTEATVRFVFDPMGKMEEYLKRPAITRLSLVPWAASTGWVIFNPHVEFPGELVTACDTFARYAYAAASKIRGRKIWFCDELQDYARHRIPKGVGLVFFSGRNYGLATGCTVLAPNQLEWSLATQFTEIVCFSHRQPAVLRSLADLGFDPKEIASLPLRSWIARNLLTNQQTHSSKVRLG
jgi:hypothetical protein